MAIDGSQIVTIMRKVTGRIDANDPQFTDEIMLDYASKFINLVMPQEVRLYQYKSWYTFTLTTTTVDPLPINLSNINVSTLGPPAYAGGYELEWFQDPGRFYAKWPETQTYTAQRPTDVLYYDKKLVFRGPPDQDYVIKIQSYRTEIELTGTANNIEFDYMFRYIAYGASLDIFSDYGEMDEWNKYYPVFMRYRGLVYARTNQQLMSQRTYPTF